ncbi:hypothetical protein QJQ45_021429, partial [Haematococcus lacustris]
HAALVHQQCTTDGGVLLPQAHAGAKRLQSSVDAAWSSHACCGVAGSCQQESLQPRDSLPAEYVNMNYRCMSSSAWAAAGCRCVAVQVAAGCRCAAMHEQQQQAAVHVLQCMSSSNRL